jgi:hypothetical protein
MSEAIAKAEAKEQIKHDIVEQAPSRSQGEMRDSIGRTATEESRENEEVFQKMQKYEGAEVEDVAEAEKIRNESEQAIKSAEVEAMREMEEVTNQTRGEQKDTTPSALSSEEIQEASKEVSASKQIETSEDAKVYENPEDDPLIAGSEKAIQDQVTEKIRGREDEYGLNNVEAERTNASIRIFERLVEENPEKMELYLDYGNEKFKDRQELVPTWYKYLKMAIEFLMNKKNVEKLEKEYGIKEGKKVVIENRIWIITKMDDKGVELEAEDSGEQRDIKGERLDAFTKAVENNSDKTQTESISAEPETKTQTQEQEQKPENGSTKMHPETMFGGNDWRAPNPEAPARARGNLGESATPQNGPAYVSDGDPDIVVQTGQELEDIEKIKK